MATTGGISMAKMVEAMYKIIVTGNGEPPLPEVVRTHETWITEQKKCKEASEKESREMKRSIALAFLGQIVTLVIAAIIAYLK